MFITLLATNFAIAFIVCLVVVTIFRKSLTKIMQRLVAEDLHTAWSKYVTFAIFVVGLSGGVRIWELEKYITPKAEGKGVLELTQDRWVLEVYGTIIGTLQSIAWMLLLFFLFALIAYVIVKGMEVRKTKA